MDCLVASNVLKGLSDNQDIVKAKQRLQMQLINQKRLGRKKSMVFSKLLLKALKNNKLNGGGNMAGRLSNNPVLSSNRKSRAALAKMLSKQRANEKRLRMI